MGAPIPPQLPATSFPSHHKDRMPAPPGRPGPPLREITRDRHRLFIFGSLTPLPASFEWATSRVDRVLSEATGFFGAPSIHARTSNPLRLRGLMRDLGRLRKLPPGQTLADVLPAPAHARFLDTLKRHAPRKRKMLRTAGIALPGEALQTALPSRRFPWRST